MIPIYITSLSMARSGHNFVLQNVLSWLKNGDKMVHVNLESIKPKDLMPNHLKHGGIRLLIWRDFDDWLASSIAKSYKIHPTLSLRENYMPAYIDKIITTYDAIIQEALYPQYYKNSIAIHYDGFVESQKQRMALCDHLKGDYSEDRLDFVPPNGHHSSFDGDSFKHSGSKMKVLNRAQEILNTNQSEFYKSVMKQYGR